jgi:hypothetical protein
MLTAIRKISCAREPNQKAGPNEPRNDNDDKLPVIPDRALPLPVIRFILCVTVQKGQLSDADADPGAPSSDPDHLLTNIAQSHAENPEDNAHTTDDVRQR